MGGAAADILPGGSRQPFNLSSNAFHFFVGTVFFSMHMRGAPLSQALQTAAPDSGRNHRFRFPPELQRRTAFPRLAAGPPASVACICRPCPTRAATSQSHSHPVGYQKGVLQRCIWLDAPYVLFCNFFHGSAEPNVSAWSLSCFAEAAFIGDKDSQPSGDHCLLFGPALVATLPF